jgi:2-polyprenyl-3-methyl-5-hydroxy-6-metoxy-1,4-benzoquinol methylase
MVANPKRQVQQNIDYYEIHAAEYNKNTQNLDLRSTYAPFLKHMPRGAHVLDAGCGSGRDSRYFVQLGLQVTAFDATQAMVNLAARFTGLNILQLRFDEVSFVNQFDGIWANASLLHTPGEQIDEVISKLVRALKIQGVIFMSFKRGEGEIIRNGRWFNSYTAPTLHGLIDHQGTLSVIDLWENEDSRPERKGQYWINALARKQ